MSATSDADRGAPPVDFGPYLAPTSFLDFGSPEVARFAREVSAPATSDRERAVLLFRAVRDRIRYDPYSIDLSPRGFSASTTLAKGRAFCVPKAILLAASLRCLGIPCRLGYADVKNHLATRRLLEALGTNLFVFHGYVEIWLGHRWIKATPTFNATLCKRFKVAPLEFDGEHDALFQPYDGTGEMHLEYVHDRGVHADFPYEAMLASWRETYPTLFGGGVATAAGLDFEAEAAAEHASTGR